MPSETIQHPLCVPPHVLALRERMRDFAIRTKPDPDLKRDLKPGFLLPYLLEFDSMTYSRWQYWLEAMEQGSLPERPIPPVDWMSSPDPRTRQMITASLDSIPHHGSWETISGGAYFTYMVEWLLWEFGHPGCEEPHEPAGCEGASMRLYQVVNINAWSLWPFDYLGSLLAERAYGRQQGFFPTPMPVCLAMVSMMTAHSDGDPRLKSVCDPAMGTGRLLLAASNYSLNLHGCDIDRTLCLATLVNGYLYCPWLPRPLPFLDAHPVVPADRTRTQDAPEQQPLPLATAPAGDLRAGAEQIPRRMPVPKNRRAVQDPDGQGSLFP